jgi:hypothetical protein
MRVITAAVAAIVALAANAAPGLAQPSTEMETLTDKEVPVTVASRVRCKTPSGPMTRRPFAGGFVFIQSCADSTEPLVRVVYATDRDGTGARMSALSTVSFLPAENEIAGTTRRLTRRICRAEGRWRMEGKKPAPGLVYWRQTKDCDGNTGWQTVTGRAR